MLKKFYLLLQHQNRLSKLGLYKIEKPSAIHVLDLPSEKQLKATQIR